MKLDPANLPDSVREVEGLYYDESTHLLYNQDGYDTGRTFEDVRSTIWGFQWLGFFYRLNPLGFATVDTAMAMQAWCQAIAPSSLSIVMFEDKSAMSGFVKRNVPERLIRVTVGEKTEDFSAGRLACSIIRNGLVWAQQSWLAELKLAGFSVTTSIAARSLTGEGPQTVDKILTVTRVIRKR